MTDENIQSGLIPAELEIRAVGCDLSAALAALNARSFLSLSARPWTVEDFNQILGDEKSRAFGAFLSSREMAGYVLLRQVFDEAEILSIGVLESCRGKGIGSTLITSAAQSAIEAGANRLLLEVAEDNTTAIRFYENLGFAEIGKRPKYYLCDRNSRHIAALLLAAPLPLVGSEPRPATATT